MNIIKVRLCRPSPKLQTLLLSEMVTQLLLHLLRREIRVALLQRLRPQEAQERMGLLRRQLPRREVATHQMVQMVGIIRETLLCGEDRMRKRKYEFSKY